LYAFIASFLCIIKVSSVFVEIEGDTVKVGGMAKIVEEREVTL